MKKTVFYALAAFSLLACAKENSQDVQNASQAPARQSLTALFADDTKTFFDDATFKWKSGDQIMVRSNNAAGFSVFSYSGDDTAGAATFTNDSEDVIVTDNTGYAIYSSVTSGHKVEENQLKINLASSYTWSAGNVQAPMLAKVAAGEPLEFKQLGGLLKVTYKNVPPKAVKLVVEAPVTDAALLAAGKVDYKISGTMKETHNWEEPAGFGAQTPYLQAYDHSTEYKISVNINAATAAQRASDDGITVYIPLPVGPVEESSQHKYPQLKVWLAFNDNTVVPGTLKTASNVQIERATITEMPAIALTKYSVQTIAGTGTAYNAPGDKTNAAVGTDAKMGNVRGLILKDNNTLVVLEANYTIRQIDITPGGTFAVSTLYGGTDKTNVSVPWRGTLYNNKIYFADKDLSRLVEYTPGETPVNKKSLWGFPVASANKSPMDLKFDGEGYPYVPMRDAYTVYKLPTAFTGSTPAVFADFSSANTAVTAGKDIQLTAIEFDSNGNLLVLAGNNGWGIFRVKPNGDIKKIAGKGTKAADYAGLIDGDALGSATFPGDVYGMALDASGNIYVGSKWCVRKITFSGSDYEGGVVTTIAGNGTAALNNGSGANCSFADVYDLEFNSTYTKLFVSESGKGVVRVITIE